MKLLTLAPLLLALACAKVVPVEQPRIDPRIIEAIIHVESRGNPKAISHTNDYGIMQVNWKTGRDMGYSKADLLDPVKGQEAGERYLGIMLDQFGNIETALAAYHCGPGNYKAAHCKAYSKRVLKLAEVNQPKPWLHGPEVVP